MKCVENVIVTVCLHPGNRTLDMELPAFLPMEALEAHFLETMREMDPLHYSAMSSVTFRSGSQKLTGTMTLAEAGVWDGAVLDAHLGEGM